MLATLPLSMSPESNIFQKHLSWNSVCAQGEKFFWRFLIATRFINKQVKQPSLSISLVCKVIKPCVITKLLSHTHFCSFVVHCRAESVQRDRISRFVWTVTTEQFQTTALCHLAQHQMSGNLAFIFYVTIYFHVLHMYYIVYSLF